MYQGLYADWQSLRQERRPADMVAASQITSAMLTGPAASDSAAESVSFRPKIYISAEVDETALQNLREIGDVKYAPYRLEGILLTGDDLVQTLNGYQVFVTEVDIVDAECLLKLPDLRMVIVCRGNPVNIDIPACTAASVPVTNTPARNADAVADLAVSFMLMLARRLQGAVGFLHQPGGEAGDMGRMGQAHEEFLGVELWHKTIGVVGGGAIGRKVIQRLLSFGTRLLLFDPFLTNEQAILMGAEKVSFERLLAESDFISLHAPVTDDTRNMMDGRAFNMMKPGAFLVNTARAALVDQAALIDSLRSVDWAAPHSTCSRSSRPRQTIPCWVSQMLLPHHTWVEIRLRWLPTRARSSPPNSNSCWRGNAQNISLTQQRSSHLPGPAQRKTDEITLRERVSAPGSGRDRPGCRCRKKRKPERKKPNFETAGDRECYSNGKVDSYGQQPST